MNTNKFLIGGIVGGVAYFLLGWLIYGYLLKSQMDEAMGGPTDPAKMAMWAIIVGNMGQGFFISWIFQRAGINSMASGAAAGGVIGLLLSTGMDFLMFGVSGMGSLQWIFMDIAASTIMTVIVGAVIGMVLAMGDKKAA